ncbi:VaFE repeat-containing surface-anchored protein [Limosilactobacillus allomucosae]|uniref:VaFE repeat-containing surface-anchored protein n=1 Tax=Limosilactobacillus allomucosae TaxID=3142938 RepID=UPI0032671A92
MKKVTKLPEQKKLKNKKSLKFLSALTMALPMFLGSAESAKAAREVDTIPQTVSISSKRLPAYVSRVSGSGGWDGGLYDRMTDNEGDVFYCLDPSKYTPNGNVSYSSEQNEKVRAVLRAGTGGASTDNSDEAYFATQLAVWSASGAINNITWTPGSGVDQAATDRVHNIYNQLMSAANDPNWQSDTSSTLQIEKVGEAQGNEDAGNFTQKLKIDGSGLGDTIGINLQGASNATITQDGQTITNNQVKPNDEFTVTVPYDYDKGDKVSVTVTASAENRRAVAAEYNPSGNYQHTTTLYTVKSTPINASAEFSYTHPFAPNTIGYKKSDEGQPLSNVKFGIYADDNGKLGKLVKEIVTNAQGYFTITDLPAGTYWLKEEATGDDYVLDDTPRKFVLNHKTATQNLGDIINNHKEADVSTTATNQEDGSKKLQPISGNVTINDHVVYNHAFAGKKYKLTGTLMDKATGKPLTVDGKTVTATKEFTPTSSNGSVDMQFTLDASKLAGKQTVVYETLTREDNTKYTTKHENINDTGQTVEFTNPTIHTTATNNEDGSKIVQPVSSNNDVKDTVSYTDLIPGKKYKMQGTLMDKNTGKPVEVNGKPVTATQEFTPTSSNGSVDMHFKIDATKLKGHSLVAFETAYYGNSKLVDHADINDTGQTVRVTSPTIHTTATNNEDGSKQLQPLNNNDVKDMVSYTDLVPGKKYKMQGTLMDKNTGKPVEVNGKPVTATQEFTPKQASGTVEMHFKIDTTKLKGHSLVVFESASYNGQDIAVHQDINDQGQTVTVTSPSLHTTLTGDNSQKMITARDNNTLQDTVSYTDLVPGKQYTVSGTLMDKNTGNPVENNGKPVTASATFTPKTASGSVNVNFQLDSSQYKGHSLVAFEALTYKQQEIANHKDLNDTAQTVNVDVDHPAPITNTPSSVLPQTGNGKDSWIAEAIGAAAMVVTVSSAVRFARRHESGLD